MRVAVCDDEKAQQSLLEKYLKEWGEMRKVPVQTVSFLNGESFAFAWEDDKAFDLLVLDIEMGQLNGMELAAQIRRTDEEVPILFVTGYEEYIAQGYEVSALHYLLKPLHKEKLFAVLDRLQRQKKPEERICFQAEEGQLALPLSKIWFVEAEGHQCLLVTGEREYRLRENLSSTAKLLSEKQEFVRTHRSYLVNLQHICAIVKSELVLDDNRRLPLSRNAAKEVQAAWKKYYLSLA